MIKGTGRVTRSAPALSVLVLSLLLAFAPAATADPTPAQAAVALNTWRASLGELPVATATVPNWNQGCQLHNAYEQQNGVLTHYENSAAPGYTPLGATAGPDSVLAEFYGTGPPLSAASLLPAAVWDGAVFHRAALLEPRLGQIGFNSTTFSSGGAYTSWVCLWDQNIGSGEPASPAAIDNSRTTPQLTLYPSPGNGEVNVPTTFPGHEGPDPEAETGVNGAPLGWLLNVEINGPWADAGGGGIVFAHGVSATLAPDGTGNAVPVVVSQCGPNGCGSSGGTAEGPYFSGGFGIFPLHPLASKTTYHVSVSGTVTDTGASRAAKDYPFTKSWCFSTGSTYAVNGDCAAAAPGTGGGAGGGGAVVGWRRWRTGGPSRRATREQRHTVPGEEAEAGAHSARRDQRAGAQGAPGHAASWGDRGRHSAGTRPGPETGRAPIRAAAPRELAHADPAGPEPAAPAGPLKPRAVPKQDHGREGAASRRSRADRRRQGDQRRRRHDDDPPDLQIPLNAGAHVGHGRRTERAGFEPAKELSPLTRLAGECLQPLGHLSRMSAAV